jgi:hypothetical protein
MVCQGLSFFGDTTLRCGYNVLDIHHRKSVALVMLKLLQGMQIESFSP